MKIAIATGSELKIRALKKALETLNINAEIISGKTDSKISKQPFGYEETIQGALNRVTQCKQNFNPDIAIAIESGLIEISGDHFDIACIYAISKENKKSIAFSSGYFVPGWMIKEIKEKDTELGEITRRLSGDTDKDPLKYLSGNSIKREDLLSQAIILALVKLFNENKYTQQ
ncbi:MAG: inosine/xanthosine triphosphatase [Candidatus Nomurabacteria bacterium]|nr:inosine/xanthosine triphosphatase [Candidatus Nomurabacteria bacterium]